MTSFIFSYCIGNILNKSMYMINDSKMLELCEYDIHKWNECVTVTVHLRMRRQAVF